MERMVLIDPIGNSSMKPLIRGMKGDLSVRQKSENFSMTLKRLEKVEEEDDNEGNLAQLYKAGDSPISPIKKEVKIQELIDEEEELEDEKAQMNWDELTFTDKAKLFRYWSIIDFVANAV